MEAQDFWLEISAFQLHLKVRSAARLGGRFNDGQKVCWGTLLMVRAEVVTRWGLRGRHFFSVYAEWICFNKASVLGFAAEVYPIGSSTRREVNIRPLLWKQQAACCMFFYRWPFITPPGNPSIASFWPPCWHQDLLVKHHFCIWLGSRPEPADLLCLLCLFCVCIFPPFFTSRQAFLKNHRVAGKDLMFFGSCFHIFNKKKTTKKLEISQKLHVFCRGSESISAPINTEDEQVHESNSYSIICVVLLFRPIESSIKVLRLQDKLQVGTPSAMCPQSVGLIS